MKAILAILNKIGLRTKKDSYIKQDSRVILNFAYKDCVLKGSQSKDEKDKKYTEIFFNDIIAKIDVLLSSKVFYNFELINKDSNNEERENTNKLKEILNSFENNNFLNLLIKGNNLLALHSLKAKFAKQVKLIYIDPPYNTSNDSFKYNDKFKHSTWLTFMKNRLEIAREFLRDDGVIFVNMDYNEVHYLKVLMDEIFGRDNFQREIIWRMGFVSGYKTMKKIIRNHDTILLYSKNYNSVKLNKIHI
ncbi:site-specific DNA-methyltransferase [Campylobacter sp. LR264d]|nr:site-specific DNA-methyltransferase [Campylobacter sp. LR185c]KAA6225804.1 site-specific DNA-methyltransferase [Campylobacter sp. LR196d]KAA6230097.1 site-specific DNA-methyltransferase [Campylobacter sp. LR264d]KAA8603972.1 DNA methylase [Campylobacter sp. LR185c]